VPADPRILLEPVSPELCLVDPQLARAARGVVFALPPVPVRLPVPAVPAARPRVAWAPRRVTIALLAASVALNGFLVVRARERGAVAAPALRAAAGARSAATLTWQPAAGASAYDLILWRGHRRALDLWPTRTQVTVPARWRYRGVRFALHDGPYLWFVYPRLGPRGHATYGPLLASGVVGGA